MFGKSLCALTVVLGLSLARGAHADERAKGEAEMDIQAENTGQAERTDRTKTHETKALADAPFDVRADIEAKKNRYAPAVFPLVGGNSDIGVQLGVAGNVTRFHDSDQPYAWALSGVLTTSVKGGDHGAPKFVQHDYIARFVEPALLQGRLRLDLITEFVLNVEAGYWGLGNAATGALPAGQAVFGQRYQYQRTEGRERVLVRLRTDSKVDIAMGALVRYEKPVTYSGSKLADDLVRADSHGNAVLGSAPMALGGVSAGIMVDTRDTEFITRRGLFYQIGGGATAGTEEGVRYGQAAAVLCHYVSLSRAFTFASRFVGSFMFGDVPFYDLQQGGVFEPQYMIGGVNGVRGVPQGRYAGHVKVVSNTEVRITPLNPFTLFSQPLLFGSTLFVDAGRTFADYRPDPAVDGHTLAPKFGVGGGLFVFWGSSALFRIEVAYSPDAVSQNPNLPVGIYVADGLMF